MCRKMGGPDMQISLVENCIKYMSSLYILNNNNGKLAVTLPVVLSLNKLAQQCVKFSVLFYLFISIVFLGDSLHGVAFNNFMVGSLILIQSEFVEKCSV